MYHVGFRPARPVAYRLYNIFVALLLLIATLPVTLVVIVLLVATQGPAILYRGERIGMNMSAFHILKFRTLCSKRAAALTKDRTLPADADIFTPMGRFLRDSRLDELPQLINVIRGDMNICGPRPVRDVIRAQHVQSIPGYDTRFEVRPGLLGPTQAYFGHGASKRIRARMNNASVARPVSIRAEIGLTLCIISSMFTRLVRKLAKKCPVLGTKLANRCTDLTLTSSADQPAITIKTMTFDTLTVATTAPLDDTASVVVRLRNGGLRRAQIRLTATAVAGQYTYESLDDVSAHVIERYALGKVVVLAPVNQISMGTQSNTQVGTDAMALSA